jgi:hypothetical protein
MSRDLGIFKTKLNRENNKPVSFRMAALLVSKALKLQSDVISRKEKRHIKNSSKFQEIISEYEQKSLKMKPEVDGRTVCMANNENDFRHELIMNLIKHLT